MEIFGMKADLWLVIFILFIGIFVGGILTFTGSSIIKREAPPDDLDSVMVPTGPHTDSGRISLQSHRDSVIIDSDTCREITNIVGREDIHSSDEVKIQKIEIASDTFPENFRITSSGVKDFSDEDLATGNDPLKIGLTITCEGFNEQQPAP